MTIRRTAVGALASALLLVLSVPAYAGSPHFVGQTTVERSDNTLTVSGKIAGLGNETQVHVEITVDAACINPGGNHPRADNKESFGAAGDFPVQNGKALFELSVTATFQPDCTPPMSLEFSNLVIADSAHGLSRTLDGPF